ncbi:hypothetical protein CerSpe_117490 [Prunus speciosa]
MAKAIWDAIATIYFNGTYTPPVYDLKRQTHRLRQTGGSIETYYNNLQGLWQEIDFRRPNRMKCGFDIHEYNDIFQEDRVYIFLDDLGDRLDKARSDFRWLCFPPWSKNMLMSDAKISDKLR